MGILLGALGLLGDFAGWWGDLAFTTNALSSLAAVSLGIPFALFFVDQLTVARAEFAEQRAASQRAALAADDLGVAVALALRPSRREAPLEHLQRLAGVIDAAHQVLKTQRRRLSGELYQFVEDPDPLMLPLEFEAGLVGREVLERAEERYLANEPDWTAIFDPVISELNKCDGELVATVFSLSEENWRRWREHIEFEWQALERDDRPRLLVAGLQWLSAGRVASVRDALRSIGETRFLEAINSVDWSDGAVWEERLWAGNVHHTFSELLSLVANAQDWVNSVTALVCRDPVRGT
ncbi:hypothetical protein [Streptomyces canus]|uniref:hypothetical protein n=1 Tax=Streptomyces canus TaxID=58343 RepID=UPI002254E94D|nr:hypothetical protein [Streptomyces canus]MCX4853707.1 hypothetical protein [Streptomyces canus]